MQTRQQRTAFLAGQDLKAGLQATLFSCAALVPLEEHFENFKITGV